MIGRILSSAKLKKRRGDVGPSAVIVTIMALTGSVVLASGVVLFGTTLFQGGAQQESITVSGIKMWVHGTDSEGLGWGAFAVRNTGDKVLSVDRISVRGTDVPFSQWYPDFDVTSDLIQKPMNFTGWACPGASCPTNSGFLAQYDPDSTCGTEKLRIDLDGAGGEDAVCANQAAGPVGLDPGQAAIIYFKLNNGTVGSVDGGAQTSVSVFAGKTGAPQSIAIGSKI